MARRIVKTGGVVLRTRRMGETSKLVTLYTAEHGKLKVTAKGARKPRSRFGAGLELFNEVQAVCYLRDDRELQTLSDCDAICVHGRLLTDVQRFSFASAACELVDVLTIEGEPNTRLFKCVTGVLRGLEEVTEPQLEPLFWYYQLRVTAALGYRPELSRCTSCGRELTGPWVWFSAAQGGAVCADCGAVDGIRMARASLAFLARLQSIRTYSVDVIPSLPGHASEIRAALRHFLAYYGGGRSHLRALDFLDHLAAHQRPSAASNLEAPAVP